MTELNTIQSVALGIIWVGSLFYAWLLGRAYLMKSIREDLDLLEERRDG